MSTRTALSLSYADVNDAVNGGIHFLGQVANGDTVILPKGSSPPWTQSLTVNGLNFWLQGFGTDRGDSVPDPGNSTIINGPGTTAGNFINWTTNNTDFIAKISGIVFDMTVPVVNSSTIQMNGTALNHIIGGVQKGGYRVTDIRFRATVDNSTRSTTIAAGSDGQVIPGGSPQAQYTINVVDTSSFVVTTKGKILVQDSAAHSPEAVTYTGKTSTSFTGCTGGTPGATLSLGGTITQTNPVGSSSYFFKNNGAGTTGYMSGSFDHNFLDFNPTTTGAECIDSSMPGSPGNSATTWGEFNWGITYQPGGGYDWDANGNFIGTGAGTYDLRNYVEDNIFHRSGAIVDCAAGGCLNVYRHNTSWGFMGTHGIESGGNVGPRYVEHYNNHFIGNVQQSTPPYVANGIRGGAVLICNQRYTGYGVGRASYSLETYRVSAQGSADIGNADGTCFFDQNTRDNPLTVNGQTVSPVTFQRNADGTLANSGPYPGTRPGLPADTRLGTVYAISNGLATTCTVTTAGTKYTLLGLSSLVGGTPTNDIWNGFCVRNLTKASAESVGSQGTAINGLSYGMIIKSTPAGSPTGTDTAVVIFPAANGAYNLTATDQWEVRRVKTLCCNIGAGKLFAPLNGGRNSLGNPCFYTDVAQGPTNPDWDTHVQAAVGIYVKNNYTRALATSAWPGTPTDTLSTQIFAGGTQLISTFVPGGVHEESLPSGFPSNLNTPASLRIGADWVAPGFPAFNTVGCETFNSGDNVDPNSKPVAANNGCGGQYPNSVISGGLGTGKIISLSGDLGFGTVAVGASPSPTKILTISNIGNTTLTVSGITYPYSVYTDAQSYPFTIASGNSHQVTVTFAPLALTLYQGNVVVASDDTTGSPQNTIAISGSGFTPGTEIIDLSGNLNFGTIQILSSTTTTLVVNNLGTAPFVVSAISDGVGDGVYAFSPTSFTVQPFTPQNVTVTFHPIVIGTYNRTITVTTSALTGGSNQIGVQGQGAGRKIYFKYHKA